MSGSAFKFKQCNNLKERISIYLFQLNLAKPEVEAQTILP